MVMIQNIKNQLVNITDYISSLDCVSLVDLLWFRNLFLKLFALEQGADDVNWRMVCYFLSPWQLEVKQSHYFTGSSFMGRGFRLAKLYLKENRAFLKTVLWTKTMIMMQNTKKEWVRNVVDFIRQCFLHWSAVISQLVFETLKIRHATLIL